MRDDQQNTRDSRGSDWSSHAASDIGRLRAGGAGSGCGVGEQRQSPGQQAAPRQRVHAHCAGRSHTRPGSGQRWNPRMWGGYLPPDLPIVPPLDLPPGETYVEIALGASFAAGIRASDGGIDTWGGVFAGGHRPTNRLTSSRSPQGEVHRPHRGRRTRRRNHRGRRTRAVGRRRHQAHRRNRREGRSSKCARAAASASREMTRASCTDGDQGCSRQAVRPWWPTPSGDLSKSGGTGFIPDRSSPSRPRPATFWR